MKTMMMILLVVKATCYHATAGQCNEDYLTTASGKRITSAENAYEHRFIAVSRELLTEYPYGTSILVSGCEVEAYNGKWTVADTMNRRFTGCVDFLINPGMPVTNKDVTITRINNQQ